MTHRTYHIPMDIDLILLRKQLALSERIEHFLSERQDMAEEYRALRQINNMLTWIFASAEREEKGIIDDL